MSSVPTGDRQTEKKKGRSIREIVRTVVLVILGLGFVYLIIMMIINRR